VETQPVMQDAKAKWYCTEYLVQFGRNSCLAVLRRNYMLQVE
jgi:hypothetical protein